MKSARVVKPNKDLKVEEMDTPQPTGKEILVKVESAGVCHSDIHLWKGGYEGKDSQFMRVEERGVKFPLTMGHEIAGTIAKVGESVKEFSKEQRVVVYPWIGEGTCEACQIGEEHVCDNPKSLGIYQDGGYSDYVLVPDEKYLVDIVILMQTRFPLFLVRALLLILR